MKTKLIKIGNSQGVRIPKLFIEQTNLHDEIEMEATGVQIILRSAKVPREGWDEAFKEMARLGDDELLDADVIQTSNWDNEEWEW
jgi:antitoxin MazE